MDYVKDYFEEYKEIYEKAKLAVDNCNTHSMQNNLLNEVETIISEINKAISNIESNSFIDPVIVGYKENLANDKKTLENIKETVANTSWVMAIFYSTLLTNLENLEIENDSLQRIAKDKPKKSDYIVENSEGDFDSVAYSKAISIWHQKIETLKKRCEALKTQADNCITELKKIDNTILPKSENSGGIPSKSLNHSPNPKRIARIQEYGFENVRLITGEELEEYSRNHNIGYEYNTEYLEVYVSTKKYNGVEFEFAWVYDNREDEEFDIQYEKMMMFVIDDLNKIPSKCLKKIKEEDNTTIILQETVFCDKWSELDENGNLKYIGGLHSSTNNVAVHYMTNADENYYSGGILHELGHTFDRIIEPPNYSHYSTNPEYKCEDITKEELNDFLQTFSIDPEQVIWESLSDNDKNNWIGEHFANTFREYCRNPDALKMVCPRGYELMDSLFAGIE